MLTSGSKIGGFLIGDLLGKGAMGEVYKGEQLSLKRPVAIKRIATHLLENEDMVKRFKREAQVLAKVGHPNVVGVIECEEFPDQSGDKHLLLIMELIEGGRSLKAHLGKPIDWRLATCVVRMCADGLAAAFDQHVVHRDIKPDNIMMTHKGIAKLVDFGLAKAAESTALTMQAAPMGTPLFMSPEACRGEEIGHAGDLYSLGVSWWFMLVGQYPFQAANLHGLLYKHISEPLPPPTGLFDHVPPPIVKLVYQCLAKDAADRPSSAQRLVEAIESLPAQGLLIPRDARELIAAGSGGPSPGGATTAATLVSGKVDQTAATVVGGNASPNDATAATALANAGRTVAADLSPQGAVAATVVANLGPQPSAATANTIISPSTAAAQAATIVQTTQAPAPSGKGGLIAGVVVAVLALGGAAAWFATRSPAEPAPKPADPLVATASTTATPPPKPVMAPVVVPVTGVQTTTPTPVGEAPKPVAAPDPVQTTPTVAAVVTPPPEPPKPIETPKPVEPKSEPPKPVIEPQAEPTKPVVADPPKPVIEPQADPPKPVEQPKPEPPKPIEAPKPEPPKPIDTSAFDQALSAKNWKAAKSAADALPAPAQSDAQTKLSKAASAQLKSTMLAARPLVANKQYAEAAKMLTADIDAFSVADAPTQDIYRKLAVSVRQAAQEAQENP
jgi:eukaryotic-like serine/threonine-protein kinase